MPQTTTTSAPAVPAFRLQFRSEGGVAYPGGLYEWMTVLNVAGGAAPRASMLLTRHNGDLIGRPIGLFSEPIDPSRAREIADRFDAFNFAALPDPTKGDVNLNTLKLKYENGPRIIQREFNSRNLAFIQAAAPIMNDLRDLSSRLLARPDRAIQVTVEKTDDGERTRFRLRLTNIGTGPAVIGDPRLASANPALPRGYIQVAPVPISAPGTMELPPKWQRLNLEPLPPDAPENGHLLKAKESFAVLSEPWIPPAGAEYVAQGVWQDYAGPAKMDPTKVAFAVPNSAEAEAKPFVVRGAAFSSYARFTLARK